MNLFNLHTEPRKLLNYNNRLQVPEIAWDLMKNDKELMLQNKDVFMHDSTWISRWSTLTRQRATREAERVMYEAGDVHTVYYGEMWWDSFMDNGHKRITEIEDALLQSEDPEAIIEYCNFVLQGRWGEAEGIVFADEHWGELYREDVIELHGENSGI